MFLYSSFDDDSNYIHYLYKGIERYISRFYPKLLIAELFLCKSCSLYFSTIELCNHFKEHCSQGAGLPRHNRRAVSIAGGPASRLRVQRYGDFPMWARNIEKKGEKSRKRGGFVRAEIAKDAGRGGNEGEMEGGGKRGLDSRAAENGTSGGGGGAGGGSAGGGGAGGRGRLDSRAAENGTSGGGGAGNGGLW